jgi:putative ABC transport system permease protein
VTDPTGPARPGRAGGHPAPPGVDPLRFPLRMAWRELRAARRHVAIVVACIALGVAALVGVGSFAASIERTLSREARALLGGDLELRSARPLDAAGEAALDRLRADGATVLRVRELVGMARDPARGGTLLVEVKAVEAPYPLYGRLEAAPRRPLGELLGREGALVQDTLLARLGLRVGDRLLVGTERFTVTGVLVKEPDRAAGVFTIGPRVLIAAEALERTGLVRFGSRVRYRTLVRLPETLDARATRAALARDLPDPTLRITSYDEAQPGLRRFFGQLTTYLGLVGLVSLMVGGLGVAASVRTFLEKKRFAIAILKCLGAGWRPLILTYLGQTMALAALGSLLGAGLGLSVQALLVPLLAGFVPFEVAVRVDPGAVLRGIGMGLLVTLLCVLWPLRQVRAIPPALILRQPVAPEAGRVRRPWLAALPVAGGLAALAVGQAGSWTVGGIFVGASLLALVLLALLARGAAIAAARRPPLPWLAWRQGLAGLHRPGGHTAGVVVSLGVGVMLVVAVALLERSLGGHIDLERRREAPSFFFVDIQPDQAEAFARTVRSAAGGADGARPRLLPIVRGRLAAIDGQPVGRERTRDRDDAWRFTREYALTFAEAPPADNVLLEGRWWTAEEARARPRISVEEEAARAFGVGVGGRLTFEIQGVPIEAEIMSLRRVDWGTLGAGFFVIFSPGALDGAPLTYIATARVPAAAEIRVQDAVVTAFPNVTAIPVRDVLDRIGRILDQVAVAIRLVAAFVIGAGVVVMASALAATRYQRLYESAVLRTLGASRAVVARVFAVEYACLGAVAGLGGSALAVLLAWIVLRFVLEVPSAFSPLPLALGVAGPVSLAMAVGFLGTYRLLGQRPLPLLRQE